MGNLKSLLFSFILFNSFFISLQGFAALTSEEVDKVILAAKTLPSAADRNKVLGDLLMNSSAEISPPLAIKLLSALKPTPETTGLFTDTTIKGRFLSQYFQNLGTSQTLKISAKEAVALASQHFNSQSQNKLIDSFFHAKLDTLNYEDVQTLVRGLSKDGINANSAITLRNSFIDHYLVSAKFSLSPKELLSALKDQTNPFFRNATIESYFYGKIKSDELVEGDVLYLISSLAPLPNGSTTAAKIRTGWAEYRKSRGMRTSGGRIDACEPGTNPDIPEWMKEWAKQNPLPSDPREKKINSQEIPKQPDPQAFEAAQAANQRYAEKEKARLDKLQEEKEKERLEKERLEKERIAQEKARAEQERKEKEFRQKESERQEAEAREQARREKERLIKEKEAKELSDLNEDRLTKVQVRALLCKKLGVPDTTSEEDLGKAIKKKKRDLHPDKNKEDPEATAKFQNFGTYADAYERAKAL